MAAAATVSKADFFLFPCPTPAAASGEKLVYPSIFGTVGVFLGFFKFSPPLSYDL